MGFGAVNNQETSKVNLGVGVHKIEKITAKGESFLPKDAQDLPENYLKRLVITFENKSGVYVHNSLEPKELKADGTPNKLYLKPAVEIKYIISKIKGIEFDDVVITANDWDELCDFANKNIFIKDGNFNLKVLPNKASNGNFYPSLITIPPYKTATKEVTSWGLGWLHNLHFEKEITLSKKEAEDILAYNKKNASKAATSNEQGLALADDDENAPF